MNKSVIWRMALGMLAASAFATTAPTISGGLPYRGISLSGAEFGAGTIPGGYDTAYIYPTAASTDYYLSKGMNFFRLPFLWERLQPTLSAAFDATELARMHSFVDSVTAKGAYVLLDPHNYARRYNGLSNEAVIGGAITSAQFSDFWTRLSSEFKSNSHVFFGLVNEPCPTSNASTNRTSLGTATWEAAAQAAINAIRANGATNTILVPGNYYTGAWTWSTANYSSDKATNAATMIKITDPANNFIFEVHQYFDSDGSGTNTACVANADTLINSFTKWLRANGKKGFLGEFAGANNSGCQTVITNLLTNLEANSDVWMGYSWWGGGPWWGTYMFTLEPTNSGGDEPQMAWLTSALAWRNGSSSSSSAVNSSSSTAAAVLTQASQTQMVSLLPGTGLRVNVFSTAMTQIRVYNYIGEQVGFKTTQGPGILDLGIQKSGLYLIKVQNENGSEVLRTTIIR